MAVRPRSLIWTRVIDEILKGKTCWRHWELSPLDPDAFLLWAAEMQKTHDQVRCVDCGLWHVWMLRDEAENRDVLALTSSEVPVYAGLSMRPALEARSLREGVS